MQTETIELAETGTTDAEGLAFAISATEPRYTFFKYTHSLEGTEQSPIVFIYTCPPGSKIKERMVYASTKTGFLSAASSILGIEIAKKVRPRIVKGIATETDLGLFSSKRRVLRRSQTQHWKRSFGRSRRKNKGSRDQRGLESGDDVEAKPGRLVLVFDARQKPILDLYTL